MPRTNRPRTTSSLLDMIFSLLRDRNTEENNMENGIEGNTQIIYAKEQVGTILFLRWRLLRYLFRHIPGLFPAISQLFSATLNEGDSPRRRNFKLRHQPTPNAASIPPHFQKNRNQGRSNEDRTPAVAIDIVVIVAMRCSAVVVIVCPPPTCRIRQ